MFDQRDRIWIRREFEQVHKENAFILKSVEDLKRQNVFLVPELESVINQVSRRALSIDKKVPDKTIEG